jgi:hypothetical protein
LQRFEETTIFTTSLIKQLKAQFINNDKYFLKC